MLKAPEWKSLPESLGAEIGSTLPAGTLVARRVWWETADKTRPPAIALRFQEKEAVAAGLVGLDPAEANLTAQDKNMIEGSWLDGSSPQQLLLSRHLAEQLGITSLAAKPQVFLWGIPFTVQGIFDGKGYSAAGDLDGEPQTPVVYPNETSSELSEAEAEAAVPGQEIATMASR